MAKTVIDAREALMDIQSGMDDAGLMRKYKLSAKGLQSLFGKLENAGIVKKVNPQDLLNDMKSGISPQALMKKYSLSPKALQRLIQDLENFGFLKYLESPRRAERETIRIRMNEIVAEIRSRSNESRLMEKYGLSATGLHRLYAKLVDAGAITSQEIELMAVTCSDTITMKNFRRTPRNYPVVGIGVWDMTSASPSGVLVDISEQGVGVKGFACEVGAEKTLLVSPDEALELKPFFFTAACRWSGTRELMEEPASGYAITAIDAESLERMREFLRLATVLFDEALL